MSKREYLSRYQLIIRKLRKSPATFAEIKEFLRRESELQEYDFDISLRTFQRDVEDIAATLGILIKYDFSAKVYLIDEEIAESGSARSRILEAFDVFNAYNMTENLNEFIFFENRRPQGMEHFYGLVKAIRGNQVIELYYQKFYDDKPTRRLLQPLALKEFKGRWYLLAYEDGTLILKTFGLDRITEVHSLSRKFRKPAYAAISDLFGDCFGIINPNEQKAELVELRFTFAHGRYIRSFPLHSSQKIIFEDQKKDETIVILRVKITYDFVMELLSYGSGLKVLRPKTLANALRSNYRKALQIYESPAS